MWRSIDLIQIDASPFCFPERRLASHRSDDMRQLLKRLVSPGFLAWCVLALLMNTPVQATEWTSQSLPNYDRLFQRTNGWIGADGDFTVKLPDGRTLWLFSDTFVGEVRDGQRKSAQMIHNSVALQQGNSSSTARLVFYYGTSPEGKPKALISPADGKGWFWLYDGAMADGKLFLFLMQIDKTGSKSVFGFRQIGNWLGTVSNPSASPTNWQIVQTKIPFAHNTAEEHVSFGSATLVTNGYVYIYGTRDREKLPRMMILARAPEADPGNFATWQFRTHDGWSTNASDAAGLCDGLATEYSVSWLPAMKKFVLVYTEKGLSEKILIRTAANPWGEWSKPTVVFHCPEAKWDKRIFCYAAKAHPLLASGNDELVITYAANSHKFNQLLSDARLYWPRFVRLTWSDQTSCQPR